ncbi:hypothetical protein ANN_04282 [Periplaneta americana]|uniref:Uncharacterized protein n=1 Tax=Periplaneta americana TaxID=6978 RepID=A0ABQ8T852_PERAM|nr:hypothetical protein ANN_04282 [Periplaneta americana]
MNDVKPEVWPVSGLSVKREHGGTPHFWWRGRDIRSGDLTLVIADDSILSARKGKSVHLLVLNPLVLSSYYKIHFQAFEFQDLVNKFRETRSIQVNVVSHLYRWWAAHWPGRSPDLRFLDLHLWAYMKALVYQNPVNTEEDLVALMVAAAGEVRDNAHDVQQSLVRRMELCRQGNGGYFEHLL